MLDRIAPQPEAILIAPDPGRPGQHVRMQFRRVVPAFPAVVAIDGGKLVGA